MCSTREKVSATLVILKKYEYLNRFLFNMNQSFAYKPQADKFWINLLHISKDLFKLITPFFKVKQIKKQRKKSLWTSTDFSFHFLWSQVTNSSCGRYWKKLPHGRKILCLLKNKTID